MIKLDTYHGLCIALKKKHSKTGEESRYQGTVLGIPAEDKSIIIEGGPSESIQAWGAKIRENGQISKPTPIPVTSSSSSPLSEMLAWERSYFFTTTKLRIPYK